MTAKASFLALLRAGQVTPDQIDDYIAKWHDGAGRNQQLHEFLGFADLSEYARWVKEPSSLPAIAANT